MSIHEHVLAEHEGVNPPEDWCAASLPITCGPVRLLVEILIRRVEPGRWQLIQQWEQPD